MKSSKFLIAGTAFALLALSTGCAAGNARQTSTKLVEGATSPSQASPSENKADQGTTTSSEVGLTSTMRVRLQAYYAKQNAHIVSSQYFSSDHGLLVESQLDNQSVASRYCWWDTQTGGHFSVPTGPDYTKLLQASPLKIRLEATGRNNIDAFVAFPSIIDDTRGNNASAFDMHTRPYYLRLTHAVQFGDHRTDLMTYVYLTADGFQAVFGWPPGDKSQFYAGSAGCPTMETDYQQQTRIFTIRFQHTTLSTVAKREVTALTNGFIESASVNVSGGNTVIQLRLRPNVAYYNAKQSFIHDQMSLPYVLFHFASETTQSYPTYPIVLEK